MDGFLDIRAVIDTDHMKEPKLHSTCQQVLLHVVVLELGDHCVECVLGRALEPGADFILDTARLVFGTAARIIKTTMIIARMLGLVEVAATTALRRSEL